MVAEDREDGAGIVGGDRLAESEIGRQDRRALLEPRLVLRQQLAEDALALLQLLLDRLPRDLRLERITSSAPMPAPATAGSEEDYDTRAQGEKRGSWRTAASRPVAQQVERGLVFRLARMQAKYTTARGAARVSLNDCAATPSALRIQARAEGTGGKLAQRAMPEGRCARIGVGPPSSPTVVMVQPRVTTPAVARTSVGDLAGRADLEGASPARTRDVVQD